MLRTLCWRSFVRTLLGTQSLEFASWNQELHSFASKRTLVHLAANGSNEPKVPDAAACTFLHEGRFAVVRCAIHQGHQCGTNRSCANAACADAAFTRSRGDDYLALSTFHRTGPSSKTTCKIRKLALHPTHHKFWPSPRRQAVEIH